jgi:amidophosphoribosyltransferase
MCGIFGIYGSEHAAHLATLGLFAQQHRGQESCGMAVNDGKVFRLRKKMGLVKEVFTPKKLKALSGHTAIGHVRYPTCGTSSVYNSQPHIVETLSGPAYALASNGDIINYKELRGELEAHGVYFASDNDGELLLKYIVYLVEREGYNITDAIGMVMKTVKGAYSTVMATKDKMYIFRDPNGFRPLIYGERQDASVIAASENCALDILSPSWQKEVKPAEIIVVSDNGIENIVNNPNEFRPYSHDQHCIFEHIYFARPDSFIFGENVYEIREKIGALLADEDDVEAEVVIPVPDSSNFIAFGYAKQKALPFQMGLIRNHYVGRTFIKPEQTIRDESVRQKFNILPNYFKGKKVILVDDSIVRGTTIKKIAYMIREAGASQIHLRIGSPQVKFSCYYGIDTPTKEELVANNKTLEELRTYVGVDTIKYISIDTLKKAVSTPDDYCYACFDGKYPLK